jgi:hypothetical protein
MSGGGGGDLIPILEVIVAVAAVEIGGPIVGAAIMGEEAAGAEAVGAAVGGAAKVSAGAAAVGAAVMGGGTSAAITAANGGNGDDILKSAATGVVLGAAGSEISAQAQGVVPDLGSTGAAAVGGAAKGALTAGVKGGDIGAGAVGGALGSALGTEIGGTSGKIFGGAFGSATGAQLAGGDVGKSALSGAVGGLTSALGSNLAQTFNPQTGQEVAYNPQTTQLAENQGTVTLGSPQVATDAPTGTYSFTPLPKGVMFNPDINQYTYADGRIYEPTANEEPNNNLSITGANQYPTSTADYSGGGSKSSTLLGGPLGTQTTSPLSAGSLDVTGKQTSTIDEGGTTQKGQASPSDKPQLITPTIVSSSGGGQSPQVLSSVLGAPSSSILGQALQSSNPDPATTGNPVFEGDGKNKRNVWNTESLRTALGLS